MTKFIALFSLLALVATESLAAPVEGASSVAKRCTRKNGASASSAAVSASIASASSVAASSAVVASSVVVASSTGDAEDAAPTSTEVVVSASTSSAASVETSVIGNNNNAIVTSSTSSAAAAATSAASGGSNLGTISNADMETLLDLHNQFRKSYGAGDLTWNSTIASFAQEQAEKCVFKHSGSKLYGENIAAGVGGGYDATSGFNGWADEASKYNYNDPVFTAGTGHFTQVVWKATSQLGCAVVQCPVGSMFDANKYPETNTLVWCNYYTPGNYEGEFATNVGRKTG